MDPIQSLLAVLLVLGLLATTLAVLRRRSMLTWRMPGSVSPASRRMELVERISLSPNHTLHLVRIGDRSVLVATTPGSCQILDTQPREEGTSGQ